MLQDVKNRICDERAAYLVDRTHGTSTDINERLANLPDKRIADRTEARRAMGVTGDRWLGKDTNVVLVMGMEHMRYFAEAGWSKQQMREYLFPKLTAPPGKGESPVRLGKDDGILIVAAGGHGMSETWVLHPHLAWAITKPIDLA
ncbi:MAG: hypothetical protein IIB12_08755 [Chloroflexi bacterium]|nr:hypothetical protein [Chloroflexota bacterium]